jgi:hypothetical protein
MSGLIREEISERAYSYLIGEQEEGELLSEFQNTAYLTSTVNVVYGSYNKNKTWEPDKYFATKIDFEKLTPEEVLKTTLSEIINLKKSLRRVFKGL